jgi:hypothetical protein
MRSAVAPRSPLDYDVSVAADKRRRQRSRGASGAVETSFKNCEWPGCGVSAQYRAPHSPERLNDFRWFCLAHVRQYNAGWNFFDGWSEQELDAQSRADRVWERATWTLGKGPKAPLGAQPHAEGNAWARFGFRDPFEVLGDAATRNPGQAANEPRNRRRMTREEQVAMDALSLSYGVETRTEVRARYRELVKDLHPDMNGGNNPDPDRLARVLKAWQILRKSRNFAD